MSYIGPEPQEAFTSYQTETFSVSATTSYTLSHSVANENELALFINNVRQQPGSGKAYTASGTTLTLSAATATTDTMYAIYLGRALQTSVPHTNSITESMLAVAPAASNWRLTTAYEVGTTSKAYHTSNLEQVDTTGQGILGSAMTESSGVFTFPSTGIWYVGHHLYAYDTADWAYAYSEIDVTTNNSDYTEVAQTVTHNYDGTGNREASAYASTLIDVTDTSNVKVKFGLTASTTGVTVWGSSNRNATSMMFIRLGDT